MACTFDLDTSRAISIADAAQQWQKVGGSVGTTVVAVAVALAESGLDPYATSSTCARGLWQIEDASYIEGRPTAEQLFDTYNNAYWARAISNNGADWGAWDVAYAAGERLTRRYSIAYPERGSKAAAVIPIVTRAIGDATDLVGRGGTYAGQLRKHHRISMWKHAPGSANSTRFGYSSAACPGGINYCSDATAWANCCYDIGGSYTISVNQAFNYLQNAGFYGDLPYIFLGLMQRESSFTPDVIARCPPCCCTEAGVTAVGLLQVVIEAWPQFGVEWLKNPANNCAAAMVVYNQQGLGAWTPLNGLDSASSVAYWRGQVSSGGTGQPPSTGGLPGTPNPEPQLEPPPEIPTPPPAPTILPPTDTERLNYPHDPEAPDYGKWGWEAVNRYFGNDLPYYTGYDAYLVRLLEDLARRTA